jgi:NarL family two-component system response regulator LiaR
MNMGVKKIRVLIVDDHAVVRQGLRTFLELQDDPSALPIEVVGEAGNGIEAVDLARRLQPDVVLLDLVMPEMDGVQATSRIVRSNPRSRVIILTSFGEEDKVFPAIRAGAQGYLLKDIAPLEVVRAVRAAFIGQVQLHPDIARTLLSAVAAKAQPAASHGPAPPEELTQRELEVLRLIAGGLGNREIAEKLVISEKAVWMRRPVVESLEQVLAGRDRALRVVSHLVVVKHSEHAEMAEPSFRGRN